MDPGHRSWAPPGGNAHGPHDHNQSQPSRPGTNYGPGGGPNQPHQSPPSGHSGLPPPPGVPFPPFHQPQHSLASLAGLTQSSPRQHARSDMPQQQGYALPALSQATGQPSMAERERERAREAEQIHIKEEEDRRREQERQRLEQGPPSQQQQQQQQQQQTGPVHLHQPVAVGPRSIHGPNGLLGNPSNPSPMQIGGPGAPSHMFGGGQPGQPPNGQPVQPGYHGPYGVAAHAAPQPPPPQQAPPPQQQMGQGPGQQPILNDALSYLDQVKVQFAEHPDVYNRFLDIMKDFKSGAIDTPGVINRVSALFVGNPDLIQGFNTFLPPGYRIDCGGDDPNYIRVTTPTGSTMQQINKLPGVGLQDGEDASRPVNGSYTPQPGSHSAQMMFSPSGRPIGPTAPAQHLTAMDVVRQQEQQAMHQQEQRGVNSLQNAVSAAATAGGLRPGVSPRATPIPGQDPNGLGADASQQGLEKRGPVEFNHAINYVNKIKTRFASQPDIYKQFLEILQTYQRESKPIQDVYGQVTHLFKTAPDLLEDFKQFLPESAAHAKAAERERQSMEDVAAFSNVRGDGMGPYASPIVSRETHLGTPNHARGGLPPVGNFAPTPVSKDNNKRKRVDRPAPNGTAAESSLAQNGTKASQFSGPNAKRMKPTTSTAVKPVVDQPLPSPSLIPALPVPIEPTTTSVATHEELAFFEKVKKTIGNKAAMNEFLKTCNLFTQDHIDRSTLIHRAAQFIGGNPELMKWFKDFIGYDERDITIQNQPRVPSGRVSLSNCRGQGPSYRLLPKRERQKVCSGRDELCNAVLNDEWASHPTWASEDSGFIAHRKNTHEEGLHRIEEERHDYDYNIEACNRTVQLLEPIASQLRRMDDYQQRNYQLPPGLGGQSETIYKRIIMKLYGREKGRGVIESLHTTPYQVIPVLLNRLKERLETWKMAQREWEKIWREQTQKMFWKSLDHQAALLKPNVPRQFQMKTLQSEIQVKYEEMKRANLSHPGTLRQPQLEFVIDDADVIVDTTYLILRYVEASLSTDHPRLYAFIRDFVPLFFGLDAPSFKDRVDELINRSPNNESIEDLQSGSEDALLSSKGRKSIKNSNLLRSALDPSRRRREDSNASGSRASTPDATSRVEDEMVTETIEEESQQKDATARWLDHPVAGNKIGAKDVNPSEPQRRDTFPYWANATSYCFVRLFVMLYERLYRLKIAESEVREAVSNARRNKPAIEIGIMDKLPQDFFSDISDNAYFYGQMLQKFDDFIRNEIEFADIEETLRRYYLQSGYPLYAFDKIVVATTRTAVQLMNNDAKDKSADIFQLFKKDRQREMTTAQQQTDYRKAVERLVKDPEMYKITFNQLSNKIAIYLTRKDDPIAADGLTAFDRENRWRYYIASYTSVDKTEGVQAASFPFVVSNVRAFGADPQSEAFPPTVDDDYRDTIANRFLDMRNEENLEIRIGVDGYRATFAPETWESFHAQPKERAWGMESAEAVKEAREKAVQDESFWADKPGAEELAGRDAAWKEMVEKGGVWDELIKKDLNATATEGNGQAMDVE